MDGAHFDLIIGINLIGVFNGVSVFASDMRARGRGHIVNTASMAGISVMPNMGGYVASKFGVVGLTETLRAELAPHGVGVSAFCPGMVATSLFANTRQFGGQTRMPEGHQLTGQSPADAAEIVMKAISENAAYIFTDPAMWRAGVETRVKTLLDAMVE
jgi:short-subunit dehydrogenase